MRTSPILLSIALLCASGHVFAAESRHMSPDGDGSCPETAANNEIIDDVDADAAAAPARRTQKTKPAPAARASGGNGSGGQRSSAPRWHSFLPGMFR